MNDLFRVLNDAASEILVAAAAAVFALAGLIARSMFTTVREAAKVVETNGKQQGTIEAQAECIEAQESQIAAQKGRIDAQGKEIERLKRRVRMLEQIIRDDRRAEA